MKALALILSVLSVALPVRAETVAVQSGEHEGFSRIVIDLSQPTPWQFGRTADGYRLRLDREGIRFDLSEVFRMIPRTRLAAIWADPATGDLQLGIGCACHAQPFEFREDVIVIDIRDGPPPRGSSFEQAFDGTVLPALAGRVPPRPRARPAAALPDVADWARLFRESQTPIIALPPAEVQAMRENLLRQLSRSAAQGLVEMDMPAGGLDQGAAEEAAPADPLAQRHIRTGFGPGVAVTTARDPAPVLTPQGDVCVADDRLRVADWADDRPFAEQLAETRARAVGEFDRPDPEAVDRQTRLLLHFGFGAEARDTMKSFGVQSPDAPLWAAMAAIVDEEDPPADNPLAGQADCDTNAALWAVLSRPDLKRSDRPRVPAILRAFSGLPPALRRQLGPGLADRFLGLDDAATARAIRDAMLRAPGDPGDAARLAEARLDLHEGEAAAAAEGIEEVAADGGPLLPEALIDLVDARIAMGEPVDAATVEAIAALAQEQADGPLGPALRRAEGMARASGGDFAAAFALAEGAEPDFGAELWPLLAGSGPDSALLAHAVLPPGAVPGTDPATATAIARRLIGLGFPDAALVWLPPVEGDPERALLAARAELDRRDGRAALRQLAGRTGAEADALRAEAQMLLGDALGASAAFAAAGEDAAAERALWQGQDWASIAAGPDPVLAAAAALVAGDPAAPTLPVLPSDAGRPPAAPVSLAQARALVEESAAARSAVEAMLGTVPAPAAAAP